MTGIIIFIWIGYKLAPPKTPHLYETPLFSFPAAPERAAVWHRNRLYMQF